MRGCTFFFRSRWALAIFSVALLATSTWAADHEKVLHSFGNGTDGALTSAGLIFDGAGNLYGATHGGGIHPCEGFGCGTVFELSPTQDGVWAETVLHSFGNGTDGAYPYAALIFDAAGNLYGTTLEGGIHGDGTVFELSPREDGGWTETVLHSFDGGNHGRYPNGSLIFDVAGNLYGATSEGGTQDGGTVFELSPRQDGGWTETVLRNFGHGGDGADPNGGLIFDAAGNLYGTTSQGGVHDCLEGGCGTVFELTPNGSGGWTETVLHSFGNGTDGNYPDGGLIFDAAGNLYGTTSEGGIHLSCNEGCGTVFELSPRESGGYTETVLHNFGSGADGQQPYASLIFDADGNLYGTTSEGGIHVYGGTVFELSPRDNGGWTERVLHSFGSGTDGQQPFAGLIFDSAGNLYGTTNFGGIHSSCDFSGCGIVFELTP